VGNVCFTAYKPVKPKTERKGNDYLDTGKIPLSTLPVLKTKASRRHVGMLPDFNII